VSDFSSAVRDLTLPAICAATFVMAFVSGVVPFVINTELCLLAVAATTSAPAPVIVVTAATGQMLAKFTLFLAGRGAIRLRCIRWDRREAAVAAFDKHRAHSLALVGVSAVTGLPPFYGVSLVAGALRLRPVPFLVVGTLGRIARFTVVYLAPGWLHFGS
jgi:membrane protein YqaA with SNARE-associated domain